MKSLFATAAILALCGGAAQAGAAQAGTLAQDFAHPPDDTRPMVRWWWFGSAVTAQELTREIKAMKQGGFGGFEIQPVYPLSLDDPATGVRNLTYLSDDFLGAVKTAADTGRAEGLRVDITLGSGWPYGGPHIPVTEASSRVMLTQIKLPAGTGDLALPAPGPGERPIAAFVGNDATAATPVMLVNGHITVPAAATDRTVFVISQGRTGQQVKRAGIGGEGLVLDHMNAKAVEHHLTTVGDRLMTAFGDHPPYAVFSDSLEVYGADWTDDLLAEFQKRRGYDLTPHLLALFNDLPDSAAIRHDWSLTLSELTDERYVAPVDAWAKAHGTKFRSQTYGLPPVTLSSNRLVALPEGEQPYWRRFSATRWASSANHIYGNSVTSAESWTWLHGAAFRATPLDIKAEADTLLLEGVNQFVAHGWPYSPPGVAEPGWAFYAAAVFNDHNPWWGVMPDVTAYLQRMSFLMRQGDIVADVAVLLPNDDAFAAITPGKATVDGQMPRFITEGLTTQILDAGYNFDYVDATSIALKGIDYKVLILPQVDRLSPDTYRRIADFAHNGGKVIAVGRLPGDGAGFVNRDADTQAVKAISANLFPAGPTAESDVGKALQANGPADVTGKAAAVGFVHRHVNNGDLYFVANTGNTPVTARLSFRSQTTRAQTWDARSGEIRTWTPGAAVTLAPYESRVFVFGDAADAPVTTAASSKTPLKTDVSAGWTIAFKGQTAHPIKTFTSWTDDPATQYYAGTAVYHRTLKLSTAQIRAGQVVLDFGDGTPLPAPYRQPGTSALLEPPVREAAEVFVNGKRAGSVWTAPFTLSLKNLVHAGANDLEIRVSNTAINLLASRPPADYSALNARFGERFTAQGMNNLKPLPSGLLHAITLETQP